MSILFKKSLKNPMATEGVKTEELKNQELKNQELETPELETQELKTQELKTQAQKAKDTKNDAYPRLKTTTWDMFQILARYWTRRPWCFGSALCLVALMSGADILRPILAGQLVDVLVASIGSDSNSQKVHYVLALFILIEFSALVLKWLHSRVWNYFAANNMHELLEETFERVQSYSTDWHASTFAGATVRKVTRGKNAYDSISNILWVHFLQLGIMLIGISAVMIWQFPLVGLLFTVATIIYIVMSAVLVVYYVRPANVLAAEADSGIGAALADSLSNNAVVKSFGAEEREVHRFLEFTRRWSGRARKSWNRGQDLAAMQQVLWTVLQLFTMYLVIDFAFAGNASAGDLTFLLTTSFVMGGQVRQVGDHIRQLQRNASEFADVVDFHKREAQVRDMDRAPQLKPSRGMIEFDNVTFAYHAGTPPIYKNLSISINPGEKIGLVGTSGAGKTTFVKLIQRLYDLDGGHIRIDGIAIDEVAQQSLRQAVALVPQDPHLFHRSLAENIAYAHPDATLEEIKAAARQARACQFIEDLEQGYDTLVGERGVKLSGGERQRVAIARAFLADAPIVIFDEATSSLDTLTELDIQEAMSELMQDRTTLIIAHRLSTLHDVDRILVFEAGRVVEEGSHVELLQKPQGVYRALYEKQKVQECEDSR